MELVDIIKTALPLPISFLLGLIGGVFLMYSSLLLLSGVKDKKTTIYMSVASICMVGFAPIMATFLTS
jgi:hypothetical protein